MSPRGLTTGSIFYFFLDPA
ncbi:MAG TPA: palindromic element RPE4 domain-containing protein [Rickettsia endosymbiont of Omalisus fontisbellaquei]|nr:palindromic element RPE4 domain-containing protein [Rickettsia endosymbiont of Omalisus fontisbellaquei]